MFKIESGQNLKKSDLIYIYGTLFLDTGKPDSEFNKNAKIRFKELFGVDEKVKYLTNKENKNYDRSYFKNALRIANIDSYLESKTNEKISELNKTPTGNQFETYRSEPLTRSEIIGAESQAATTESVSRNIFIPPSPVQ